MPEFQWDVDRSIRAAEKLWRKLDERGYGEPRENGPREVPRAYDKLSTEQKAGFDLFWIAFDYKQARDRAALAWLKLGEIDDNELQQIIAAAKLAAQERKNLAPGISPKMAEGWLTERRWLDSSASETEKTQRAEQERKRHLQKISNDLAHAKNMADMTQDDFWPREVERLTSQLRQLRNEATACS